MRCNGTTPTCESVPNSFWNTFLTDSFDHHSSDSDMDSEDAEDPPQQTGNNAQCTCST